MLRRALQTTSIFSNRCVFPNKIEHHTNHYFSQSKSQSPTPTLDNVPGSFDPTKDGMMELLRSPYDYFKKSFNEAQNECKNNGNNLECPIKSGNLYKCITRGIETVIPFDPELSHEVLNWEVRKKARQASVPTLNLLFGENNLLGKTGAEHMRYRKQFRVPLSEKTLSKQPNYIKMIVKQTNEVFNKMINTCNKINIQDKDNYIDLISYTRQITWNVGLKFLFGDDIINTQDNQKMMKLFELIGAAISEPETNKNISNTPLYDAIEARKEIRELIGKYIKILEQKYESGSLDKESAVYQFFNETQLMQNKENEWDVIDHILGLMVAAVDSTSSSMVTSLYVMSEYKNSFEKLKSKLKENNEWNKLINNNIDLSSLTYDDINNCTYLDWYVKEIMRLIPTAATLGRFTTQDVELDGVTISPGKLMLIPLQWYQNNKDYWQKPNEFMPERFATHNPKVFMPFGKGNRQCLGIHLAYLELKLFILTYIRKECKIDIDQNRGVIVTMPSSFQRAVFFCRLTTQKQPK